MQVGIKSSRSLPPSGRGGGSGGSYLFYNDDSPTSEHRLWQKAKNTPAYVAKDFQKRIASGIPGLEIGRRHSLGGEKPSRVEIEVATGKQQEKTGRPWWGRNQSPQATLRGTTTYDLIHQTAKVGGMMRGTVDPKTGENNNSFDGFGLGSLGDPTNTTSSGNAAVQKLIVIEKLVHSLEREERKKATDAGGGYPCQQSCGSR